MGFNKITKLIQKVSGFDDAIGKIENKKLNFADMKVEFESLNEASRVENINRLKEEINQMESALETLPDVLTKTTDSTYIYQIGATVAGTTTKVLTNELAGLAGTTRMTVEEYNEFIKVQKDDLEEKKQLLPIYKFTNKELEEQSNIYKVLEDAYKATAEAQLLLLEVQIAEARALAEINGLNDEQIKGLIALEEKWSDLFDKINKGPGEPTLDKTKMAYDEYANMVISSFNATTSAFSQNVSAREEIALEELKNSARYTMASGEQRKQMEKQVSKQFLEEKRKVMIAEKAANIASATMNAAMAVSDVLARFPGGPVARTIAAGVIASLAAVQIQQIANTPIPAFAKGGDFVTSGPQVIMVGDNPGGRERVQVTPISSPNLEGPQSSNKNISFSGNVVSDDFIENEAIPKIKDAIRRGADIGIS